MANPEELQRALVCEETFVRIHQRLLRIFDVAAFDTFLRDVLPGEITVLGIPNTHVWIRVSRNGHTNPFPVIGLSDPTTNPLARVPSWMNVETTAPTTISREQIESEWPDSFVDAGAIVEIPLCPDAILAIASPPHHGVRDTDITQLKRLADILATTLTRVQSLDASRRRAQQSASIIRDMGDMLIVTTPDGHIRDANRATCSMLGLKLPELTGRPLSSLFVRDDTAVDTGDTLRVSDDKRLECQLVGRSGRPLSVLLTQSDLIDPSGTLYGRIFLGRDVTIRRRREERQRVHNSRLAEVVAIADELIAKTELDQICTRALELARRRLGVERCAVFLSTDDRTMLRCAHHTDRAGNVVDDRPFRIHRSEIWPWSQTTDETTPNWRIVHGTDMHWDAGKTTGDRQIWVGVSPILASGRKELGFFCNDAALTGASVDENTQELLSVFSVLLGHIIERKRAAAALERTLKREEVLGRIRDKIVAMRRHTDFEQLGKVWLSELRHLGIELASASVQTPATRPGYCLCRKLGKKLPDATEVAYADAPWITQARSTGEPVIAHDRLTPSDQRPSGEILEIPAGRQCSIAVRSEQNGVFTDDVIYTLRAVVPLIADAVQRADALNALRAERAVFLNIVTKSTDGNIVIDTNGMVRYTSPQAQRMLSVVSPQLARRPFFAPVTANVTSELEICGRDGRLAVGEMRVIETEWEGGPALLATIRDVTERKESERRLQRSNTQLEYALSELRQTQRQVLQRERLAALGQMAGAVAHEFNNALTTIAGYSDLLLNHDDKLLDYDTAKRYLTSVHLAANDAAESVKRLSASFRGRERDVCLEPIMFNDLVKQVVDTTAPKWKERALARGVKIILDTHLNEVPIIAGNQSELREVLMNLIFNATDATPPPGGSITITTDADENHVYVRVADTGLGMNDETRRRCLEPFFSTKKQRGVGLGLATVRSIVEQHDGMLTIDSQEGKGTTFTIGFPQDVAPTENVPQQPPSETLPSLRILCVEDERAVRELMGTYLALDGHHAELKPNGVDALAEFSEGRFDLVITDRAMPGINGDELARRIKEIEPQVPVLMLTGFGQMMADENERPPDVDAVLSKPITLDGLRTALCGLVSASDARMQGYRNDV